MLFVIWYCIDDHLAAALNMPGLGHLPWWVVFLATLGLAITTKGA